VGLQPITSGALVFDGYDVASKKRSILHEVHRNVSIIFQDPASSLNPRMPIGESIGEPIYLAGLAKGKKLSKMVEDLLDQVELPTSFRNRYPHELSGGQKQRVGIARALALKPKLLIADEPTSALDVSVQANVLEIFKQLQEEFGFACLFVTHDLAVVEMVASRLIVMSEGKIVETGSTEQILHDPQQEYTKKLISAVPIPDPIRQKERRHMRDRYVQ
jgi:peptide/nickel transport system ATP-binding protein